MALRTANFENLQQIAICPSDTVPGSPIEETVRRELQDLDHMLVQFWTSYSIRPQVMYDQLEGGEDMRDRVPDLLPELSRRGLVDFVETPLHLI